MSAEKVAEVLRTYNVNWDVDPQLLELIADDGRLSPLVDCLDWDDEIVRECVLQLFCEALDVSFPAKTLSKHTQGAAALRIKVKHDKLFSSEGI